MHASGYPPTPDSDIDYAEQERAHYLAHLAREEEYRKTMEQRQYEELAAEQAYEDEIQHIEHRLRILDFHKRTGQEHPKDLFERQQLEERRHRLYIDSGAAWDYQGHLDHAAHMEELERAQPRKHMSRAEFDALFDDFEEV